MNIICPLVLQFVLLESFLINSLYYADILALQGVFHTRELFQNLLAIYYNESYIVSQMPREICLPFFMFLLQHFQLLPSSHASFYITRKVWDNVSSFASCKPFYDHSG